MIETGGDVISFTRSDLRVDTILLKLKHLTRENGYLRINAKWSDIIPNNIWISDFFKRRTPASMITVSVKNLKIWNRDKFSFCIIHFSFLFVECLVFRLKSFGKYRFWTTVNFQTGHPGFCTKLEHFWTKHSSFFVQFSDLWGFSFKVVWKPDKFVNEHLCIVHVYDSPLSHDEFRRFIRLLRGEWRLKILQLSNDRHSAMILTTNKVKGKVVDQLVRNS